MEKETLWGAMDCRKSDWHSTCNVGTMENSLRNLVDDLGGQALVCETVAQDLNEQSLTGESRLKEKYETEAREWLLKAGVWREAESLARKHADLEGDIEPIAPNPLEAPGNVRQESDQAVAAPR